jgi:hypothetical protein
MEIRAITSLLFHFSTITSLLISPTKLYAVAHNFIRKQYILMVLESKMFGL